MKAVTNIPPLHQLSLCDGDSGWIFTIKPMEQTTNVDSYIIGLVVTIIEKFEFESDEPLIEHMNQICSNVPGNKNTFVCSNVKFYQPNDTIHGTTCEFMVNDGPKNYTITFNYNR